MNINIVIKGKNIELTEAMKQYATEKVGMVEKYIRANPDAEVHAEVELGKEVKNQMSGDVFTAVCNLSVEGELHRAEAETGDLYASIDEMKDELIRVIRRGKNKKDTLLRRGGLKFKNLIRGLSGKRGDNQ